jgi:hypothetical protein
MNVLYAFAKAALSGALVVLVSEAAKRNPSWGGLIASLPLISILAFVWLWTDTKDIPRVAAQADSTFWFVIPTLPMFVAFPWMLRHGAHFWTALGASCILTIILYSGTVWLLPKIGINV